MTDTAPVPADSDEPGELVPTTSRELARVEFSDEQAQLVKRTLLSDDTTDDEFELFMAVCRRTQLDPFARQIFGVKRRDGGTKKMTIQVSIDGFRLIANRTGRYGGQLGPWWCGADGQWQDVWLSDQPPQAARVGVIRHGFDQPLYAVALWSEYRQNKSGGELNAMWSRMPSVMLAKCFDEDTEVLTEAGFRRFEDVTTERIMQVTSDGLEPVEARPFAQPYDGPMVTWASDDLDFSVTPNHDMITTFGRVEAGAMLATSHSRGPWRIPRAVPASVKEAPLSDAEIMAAAAVLADGTQAGPHWRVAVSKQRKIDMMRRIGLSTSESVVHSRGAVADAGVRQIRSNFDKLSFLIPGAHVGYLVGHQKSVRLEALPTLSARQSRILIDTWVFFDGHTNKKTHVRRIYTSNDQHRAAFEVAAVAAGYAISPWRDRVSDISDRPNYYATISERDEIPVFGPGRGAEAPALTTLPSGGPVWCVTVPSGEIVVRRHGFSMRCGNCAEAMALRKAFPAEMGGLYSEEEMAQSGGGRDATVSANTLQWWRDLVQEIRDDAVISEEVDIAGIEASMLQKQSAHDEIEYTSVDLLPEWRVARAYQAVRKLVDEARQAIADATPNDIHEAEIVDESQPPPEVEGHDHGDTGGSDPVEPDPNRPFTEE